VAPGSYTVTETGETGWTLDDITCVDPDNGSSDAGNVATIELDAGETVTCTFSNSRDTGEIIITKAATPEDDTPFDFSHTIDVTGTLTLMDPSDNTETFVSVPTGVYTVTETVTAGWTLDDIDCDDTDSTENEAGAEAVITLGKDEQVTCTFTNSRDTGTVTIVKEADPADDTPFDFTHTLDVTGTFSLMDPSDDSITFNNVPTGSYTVAENVPAPWLLDDIDCDDGNSLEDEGTATATINLEKDESVTCTFYNSNPVVPQPDVFVSAIETGVTDDAVAFGPEDILQWEDGSGWSLWFDGSAAGLMPSGPNKHDITALWIPDPGDEDVVISFSQNARFVPGITPKVDGMDLVWYDSDTNTFSLWFDGQDVGLTNLTGEKIDALHVLDGSEAPLPLAAAAGGSCNAYLLISLQATGKVPNYDGMALNVRGEDVIGFCMTQSGSATMGKWIMVLDGSAQGMPANSTHGLSASDDGETIYLTTRAAFNVDSATGGHSMVYVYDTVTESFSGPIFSAPDEGLAEKVDGMQVE